MSAINSDLLDEGLQNVIGKDRCQNDWKPAKKQEPCKESNVAQKHINHAADASWAPVKEPNWMDRLKSCGKWAMLFGSISVLLFYWQQAGLLDPKAAVPSLIFCALGAGLTVGYHAR